MTRAVDPADLHPDRAGVGDGDLEVGPRPGGERQGLVLDRGRPDEVVAVDRQHPVRGVGPELDQRVVGVDHPQPHGVAGLGHDRHLALLAVERAHPEGVGHRDRLDVLLGRRRAAARRAGRAGP